ncbi:MAG: GNAT family N-acetyltransferase [Nitriliruptoraceae bacterium]|nr:GNAT family N-acetyltransferase [Nitriliruptoraceae bacterium]
MSVLVRPPRPPDAARLGEIHVAAWQAAYRGAMPDAYLDGLRAQDRARWWAEVLRQPLRDGDVRRIAQVDGHIHGFVLAGPAGGDDASGAGEVFALNVHPDAWRIGVGRALLTAAEAGLRDAGFARAVLWVVPGNHRARRFYERHGWVEGEAHRVEQVHDVSVEEVRYRRRLRGSAAR